MKKNNDVLYNILNKKATEIDTTILDLIKSGANPDEIKKYFKVIDVKEDYMVDFLVFYVVNWYTMKNPTIEEFNFYKSIIDRFGEVSFDINDNYLVVTTNNYTLTVMRLNKCLKGIDDVLGYDLETKKRHHNCHDASYKISQYIYGDSELVSGYCYGATDQSKYLHSFVEINSNGVEYVIDSTVNAVIEKDGYYKMRHIKDSDILSRISSEDIINDMDMYSKEFAYLDISPRDYDYFRDEIISEFEKKKKEGFKL